ncbi:MAG: hypothetical protein KAY28_00290 [Cloacibacterium sp.]|jgi:predicted transcriptional regulator|nr:hypothetical protein [Cloacibacterium sp.]MBP8084572.1 hypothetical protein [Cloacibacterium sp.]
MESIIIYPNTESEKTLLENLLKKMKISFEKKQDNQIILTEEEIADIEEGLEDFENGKNFDNKDVRKMMLECTK